LEVFRGRHRRLRQALKTLLISFAHSLYFCLFYFVVLFDFFLFGSFVFFKNSGQYFKKVFSPTKYFFFQKITILLRHQVGIFCPLREIFFCINFSNWLEFGFGVLLLDYVDIKIDNVWLVVYNFIKFLRKM